MTSPRYCSNCGAIAGRSPVCHACGAEIDENGQAKPVRGRAKAPAAPKPPKAEKEPTAPKAPKEPRPAGAPSAGPPILIFIIVALIAALIFGLYILVKGTDDGDKKTASVPPNAVVKNVGGVIQVIVPKAWVTSETAKSLTLAASASDLDLPHPEAGARIKIQVIDAGAERDPETLLRGNIPASELNVVLSQATRNTYGKDASLDSLEATIGHTYGGKPYVGRYVVAFDASRRDTPVIITLEMPAKLYLETQADAKRITDEAQKNGKPVDDTTMPDNPSLILLRLLLSASVVKK